MSRTRSSPASSAIIVRKTSAGTKYLRSTRVCSSASSMSSSRPIGSTRAADATACSAGLAEGRGRDGLTAFTDGTG